MAIICQVELMKPFFIQEDLNIVASFDRRGDHIYTGNSKGKVSAFQAKDMKLLASFRIGQGASSTTAVKTVEFSRRGE